MRRTLLFFASLAVLIAGSAHAATVGETASFFVEKEFDATGRTQVSGVMLKAGTNANFYVEKSWYDNQPEAKKQEIGAHLDLLSNEFDQTIYPNLTAVFGQEWKPGVDGDNRITVFFQSMNSTEGGYFREADEFIKLQIPTSNEREMVYVSLDLLTNFSVSKRVLAHEFTHLIAFNQKKRLQKAEEDVWLDEARADYSSAILGYDQTYEGSNLQQRVSDFIKNPSDSITEWRGTATDYASVSMFTHYLVDHYGISVLIDSLHSPAVGIESIDLALDKIKSTDRFKNIFTNWAIASVLNDCSLNQRYCYLNGNLKNFRLAPSINFLPLTGNVSLSVTNVTKTWMGNWLKFIGGNGDLVLEFSGLRGLEFQVPYIVSDSTGSYAVNFLPLDENAKGSISLDKFGQDYKFLMILPLLESPTYQATGVEPTYPYTYKITIGEETQTDQGAIIQQLLDQITYLKAEIARLQAGGSSTNLCQISSNLYFGLRNSQEVRCLQEFLKSQGSAIYPEGLVTGNFAEKTRLAVIRFQEKYAADILAPVGLARGSGYVGSQTRQKITQLKIGQ